MYKDWWPKTTISDLRFNVSLLEKHTEVNSSSCEKDEESGSLSKVQVKNGKVPMDDLKVKVSKFSATIDPIYDVVLYP